MTAVEQVRSFVQNKAGSSPDRAVGGFPELTVRNLRTLVIMAEAFQMEHPSRAAAIEHGGCTSECSHLHA